MATLEELIENAKLVEKQTKLIIIKDSKAMIFIDNLIMYGGLFILMDINYKRWDGNWLITLIIFFMLLISLVARGNKNSFTTTSKKEAIKYIKKL